MLSKANSEAKEDEGMWWVSQPSVHWAGLEKRVKKVWTDTGKVGRE